MKHLYDMHGQPLLLTLRAFQADNPLNVYVKDTQGHYVNVNEQMLLFTHESEDHFINKNDCDIFGETTGIIYRDNDQITLSRDTSSLYIEKSEAEGIPADRSISLKMPIKNSANHPCGVLGISLPIMSGHTFATDGLFAYLNRREQIELIQGVNAITALMSHALTYPEIRTLFYFIRFKNAKVIAQKIEGISHRTVEEHLNKCKIKCGMHSSHELLAYLWEIQFQYLTLKMLRLFFDKQSPLISVLV